jgi:hypothetical protein
MYKGSNKGNLPTKTADKGYYTGEGKNGPISKLTTQK